MNGRGLAHWQGVDMEDSTKTGGDRMPLVAFLRARLDEDEQAAREAVRKRYPRWRVWIRRLARGR